MECVDKQYGRGEDRTCNLFNTRKLLSDLIRWASVDFVRSYIHNQNVRLSRSQLGGGCWLRWLAGCGSKRYCGMMPSCHQNDECIN